MSRCGYNGDSTPNFKYRKVIDVDLVRRLLDYDEKTGVMRWKARPLSLFANARVGKAWNTKFTGKCATGTLMQGYPTVCIYDERFLAHRVAWAIFYGCQPPEIIDHINRDRTDLKISNLRAVTDSENARNCSLRSDNKTGLSGIWRLSPKKGGKPWAVAMGGKVRMIYKRHRNFCSALKHRNSVLFDGGFSRDHGNIHEAAKQ